MLFDVVHRQDSIATVQLVGPLVHADDFAPLPTILSNLASQGAHGVALQCSQVKRVSSAGLAGFAQLLLSDQPVRLAAFDVPDAMLKKLANAGLDHTLPLFETMGELCSSPAFRSLRLANTKAVVLCAGKGTRVAPLTSVTPKPMLDMLGRPVLAHILDYLQGFGVRDVVLNPGHLGEQIHDYFRKNRRRDQSLFYLNEGGRQAGTWRAKPLGSATTLKRLTNDHTALDGDFLVMCGDALVDLDLADLMEFHRENGADVTIAAQTVASDEVHKYGVIERSRSGRIRGFQEKPAPGEARSSLVNTGIYVINARVLDLLPDEQDLDIATHLFPLIQKHGGAMYAFAPRFQWVDIGCGRDYHNAVAKALAGEIPGVAPTGREIRPGVWAAENASVAARARISGPCYIGAGSIVTNGARIEGPSVLGPDCVVERKTIIRESLLMPGTRVGNGAIVDGKIASGDWAVTHLFADGSPQPRDPLDCVTFVDAYEPVAMEVSA